jgi:acyl-CoA reductase-like NAD-dependent aldehyde dehydrogenase
MAKAKTKTQADAPVEILKTYKMYIGGNFPCTESGRFYSPEVKGKSLGNICLASRKDVRNAIVAARAAQSGWASRTAYNRSQILYRIAEMLQGRQEQFVSELQTQGLTEKDARQEVQLTIDRMIYYSGWCDKFQQLFSSVNPVASSHFNFSVLEPTGVVVLLASQTSPLLGLANAIAPIIAGGNTCVVIANETQPLSAITFCEVLQTSDLPGGVVNVLTGRMGELMGHAAKHLDVNAIAADEIGKSELASLKEDAAGNLKRVADLRIDWTDADHAESPYLIEKFCEVKTTWHPIEQIGASGSGY